MFLGYRVNVNETLRFGLGNELEIVFDPALYRGRELEEEHVEHRFIAHNGETGRLGVRKAQYHWVSEASNLKIHDLLHAGVGLGSSAHDCRPVAASCAGDLPVANR